MMQGGQTTTSVIPLVGTFEQIKAGLGFGPKRVESKLDATVDGIAGLVNTIAAPQGKQLNRTTEEFAQLVESIEDGARGVPLAQLIIAMAAAQGIQITLAQLLQDPAPQTFLTATPGLPPETVTVDASGNVILDPRVAPILAPRVAGPVTGARGLGFTAPSGFPILPPRRAPSTPSATSGGFNFFRFIQCLAGSLLPSSPGGRRMPFQITPGPQASAGGFDFGGFLGGAADIARRFLGPTVGPGTAFPGTPRQAGFPLLAPLARAGSRLLPALPAFGGGVVGGVIEDFFDFGGAGTLDESAAFTDPIPGACRPKAHVKTNPCSGKKVWFVPRGRPLVFSGDMSACKRVDRVAKRLDKARPKRRHHHHTKHRPR